jgi:hypothetical protein
MDLSHLDALRTRLSHERDRLAGARRPEEIELRKVWIAGTEREIASEMAFLGISDSATLPDIGDDQLFRELGL